ncbi:hypothetical protein [Pseudaquabacterium pictum]|uniref:Uncharacterized protein n=1 Tax=Pseudaquabacterium pictum TaxID=2315236 RepID=A0A480AU02_9BURK|nr:hypothetical protein [Rubrivivax pictus]GCL64340.1 hypothetical protein AQPW35_34210 [Rubrivivax pictus]
MSASKYFELLQWHDASASKPDAELTVNVWSTQDALLTAHWDDERGAWIDCAHGGLITDVTHWADPKGPIDGLAIAPADVSVDQVRGALLNALELLAGWVAWKSPKRHLREHLASIEALAKAGGVKQ